jgi:hypothetical protein
MGLLFILYKEDEEYYFGGSLLMFQRKVLFPASRSKVGSTLYSQCHENLKSQTEEVFTNEGQKFEIQWIFPNCNGAIDNKQI